MSRGQNLSAKFNFIDFFYLLSGKNIMWNSLISYPHIQEISIICHTSYLCFYFTFRNQLILLSLDASSVWLINPKCNDKLAFLFLNKQNRTEENTCPMMDR